MLDMIIGKKVTNIYTVGYMETEEGNAEYYPQLRWIYFEFEDILVEFESFEQYSRLRVERVSEVRYLFEIDEEMIPMKSSIIEFVLVSSDLIGNEVKKIELKGGTEEECLAAKIILKNEQIIFLDPSFLCGIEIGGETQEEYWKYNLKE